MCDLFHLTVPCLLDRDVEELVVDGIDLVDRLVLPSLSFLDELFSFDVPPCRLCWGWQSPDTLFTVPFLLDHDLLDRPLVRSEADFESTPGTFADIEVCALRFEIVN